MNADINVTKALAALDGNRDFSVVLEWLAREKSSEMSQLLTSVNPVVVHQKQGYVLCLEDIIRSATAATKVTHLSQV